jgi:polyphosphate kinase
MVRRHPKKRPEHQRSKRDKSLIGQPESFLNRDLSLLAFNERVLAMAARAAVPLAERLR